MPKEIAPKTSVGMTYEEIFIAKLAVYFLIYFWTCKSVLCGLKTKKHKTFTRLSKNP